MFIWMLIELCPDILKLGATCVISDALDSPIYLISSPDRDFNAIGTSCTDFIRLVDNHNAFDATVFLGSSAYVEQEIAAITSSI